MGRLSRRRCSALGLARRIRLFARQELRVMALSICADLNSEGAPSLRSNTFSYMYRSEDIKSYKLMKRHALDLDSHLLFLLSSVGPLKVTSGVAFTPPRERAFAAEAAYFLPLPIVDKFLRIAAIGSGRR